MGSVCLDYRKEMTQETYRPEKITFKNIVTIIISLIICCEGKVKDIYSCEGWSRDDFRLNSPDLLYAAIRGHYVVPDVVSKAPKILCEVSFIHEEFSFKLGNILLPAAMKYPPYFICWPTENDTLYTMLMIDPDMPSRREPSLREWNHWLIGNMVGPDLSTGDTIAQYISPEPLKDTGYHRITFLVFKQPKHINFTEPLLEFDRNDTRRTHFSSRKFAEKYELGDPIAINFCLTAFNQTAIEGFDDIRESTTPKDQLIES
nr:PREDICTED: protein D1-like isoform X2 [Bemisia tabaci]